jgi:hypothetical protein
VSVDTGCRSRQFWSGGFNTCKARKTTRPQPTVEPILTANALAVEHPQSTAQAKLLARPILSGCLGGESRPLGTTVVVGRSHYC